MKRERRFGIYQSFSRALRKALEDHRAASIDKAKVDRRWVVGWRAVELVLAVVAIGAFIDQRQAFELQQEEFARQSVLYQDQLAVNKQTLIALSWEAIRNARGTAKTKADKGQIEAIQTLAKLTPKGLRAADLSDLYLEGLDLGSLKNYQEIDLSSSKLCGSNLDSANLTGINLREANLTGATLIGASLNDADLRETNLICTAFDHWSAYFDDDPFDEEPPLYRRMLCKHWMSLNEWNFWTTVEVSWAEQKEGYRETERFEIAWEQWTNRKNTASNMKPASGWETWKGAPSPCCGVELHSSSIPPRTLPWKPRAPKTNRSWPYALIKDGKVEEWYQKALGIPGKNIRTSLFDDTISRLTNQDTNYDPCRPY